MDWLVLAGGVGLILLALTDLFLTVLYPRSGRGVLSTLLNQGIWQLFRQASYGPWVDRDRLLSYCGPTLLVVIVIVWTTLLIGGFAFIVWTALGSGIQASHGSTPTDFATALYYSGYTFTTLGTGDLVPKTGTYRLLMILEAALGFSTFTLTLTYFLSVYSALTRRNTFALSLHHRTASQANAAEFLARLGANGDFNGARQEVADMGRNLLELLESHHSYPVLHYFRFQESYYSLARIALITMDTATLIKSALNQEKYRALVDSTGVTELEDGGLDALLQLSDSFLPDGHSAHQKKSKKEWRDWYFRAVERLQAANIETTPDLETGADLYISLRQKWNPYVVGFAEYMAYRWSEIAPVERE